MQRIQRVQRKTLEEKNYEGLPQSHGVMSFLKNEKPLFYIPTNNLYRLWQSLIEDRASGESNQIELLAPVLENYDTIEIYIDENALDTLIKGKKLLLSQTPEYYYQIRLSDQYCYLGISLTEPPFLRIKEDTTEDLVYIGPFPERFFVLELIDFCNRYFQMPACLGNTFPCRLFGEARCTGFCTSEDRSELKRLLMANLLTINQDNLNMLREKEQYYWDHLEFTKSEEIKKDLSLLERYFRHLLFYSTFKHFSDTVNYEERELVLERGLLQRVTEKGVTTDFKVINDNFDDYQPKEFLALPKESFREMWILYEALEKKCAKNIDSIHSSNIKGVEKLLFKEE